MSSMDISGGNKDVINGRRQVAAVVVAMRRWKRIAVSVSVIAVTPVFSVAAVAVANVMSVGKSGV